MCGIAGFFGDSLSVSREHVLGRMLEAIAHRGPDGSGTIYFDQAALGHVRLAIIDIAGGAQPMSTPDGRFHISYNGEIYNFREIRGQLVDAGEVFKTASDTEVVLRAYQRYGLDAFGLFRGMFALAIWDSQCRQGLLVRDSFGIKPLYYSIAGKQLVFASEVKGILEALPDRPGLDLNSLHLLMNFRYIPGSATMFDGVLQLPPGHCLTWREDGSCRLQCWKKSSGVTTESDWSVDQVRGALSRAVHRQLVSDVPLGGYLSAGLDSASILANAIDSPDGRSEFPTFTIQTGDSPLEAEQAAQTARHFGVVNYQEPISYNLEKMLFRSTYHLEVPKVNALQSAMVARLARKHVKVALSGLGGDEVFLGYNVHRLLAGLAYVADNPFLPVVRGMGWLGSNFFELFGLAGEEFRRGSQILQGLPDVVRAYGMLRNIWDSPEGRKRVYGSRMLAAGPDSAFDVLKGAWPGDRDPVMAAAHFELDNKMVNDLLLQEDRLSMAFGLEVRVPFLDEDLVRLVSSIDRHRRMEGGKLKQLMRQVVGEWLPPEILNRPKSGFQVPIHLFFNTHLRPLCDTHLSRQRLEDDGLFNYSFVESVLAARPHKRLRWHYFMLYLMLGTVVWLDVFERGEEIPTWQ